MSRPAERDRISRLGRTCACLNLRRAARAVTNYYDELFVAACGLRATQVSQLTVLYLAGPQTVQAIAGSLGLDRTTLTRNLKLLEEAGVIGIEPGEDQRTRIVSLTQPGTHSLLKVLPVWEKAQATVVEGIGEERFEALLGHLAEVSELDVGRAARARKTARARGQRAGHSVRARR